MCSDMLLGFHYFVFINILTANNIFIYFFFFRTDYCFKLTNIYYYQILLQNMHKHMVIVYHKSNNSIMRDNHKILSLRFQIYQ